MDTVYVHKYCIKYWDECDKKMCIERGIAFGSTFSEVVHRLEVYYGEKNIESICELTSFDVIKWYDHYNEMRALSKYFPSLYFELEGFGEEYGDMWREYFHNGEAMHSDAKITYDTPNW